MSASDDQLNTLMNSLSFTPSSETKPESPEHLIGINDVDEGVLKASRDLARRLQKSDKDEFSAKSLFEICEDLKYNSETQVAAKVANKSFILKNTLKRCRHFWLG